MVLRKKNKAQKRTSQQVARKGAKKGGKKQAVKKSNDDSNTVQIPPKTQVRASISKKKKVVQQKKSRTVKEVVPVKKQIQKKQPIKRQSRKKQVDSLKIPKEFGAYTYAQYLEYQTLHDEWQNKTSDQLKQELKQNGQVMSGLKHELVKRVCDGIILGAIPRCPNCYGGRPKFDISTGMYKCAGYRDDEDFKWCNKKYQFDEIQRTPWNGQTNENSNVVKLASQSVQSKRESMAQQLRQKDRDEILKKNRVRKI